MVLAKGGECSMVEKALHCTGHASQTNCYNYETTGSLDYRLD